VSVYALYDVFENSSGFTRVITNRFYWRSLRESNLCFSLERAGHDLGDSFEIELIECPQRVPEDFVILLYLIKLLILLVVMGGLEPPTSAL
jgi:hypothetical protein